jgi:type II secretory pathway component PulL
MMLLLEPMVVTVYEMEMMMLIGVLIVVVEVEQQADKEDEIHDDMNLHNDDQQKENHYNVLVGHDDVHEVNIEHWVLWKTVVVAVVAVVVVDVHCYYSKWAVLG